jgi:glycosyltransferase involved in cell wall biosynthesis
MRILLANKFHYPRGGDCIHALDLERLLKDQGHEVAFFAMDFPLNEPSEWHRHFPSEIAFTPRAPWKMLKACVRPVYAPEVRRKFNGLLDEFRPAVVHLHNIHTQLSPVIAQTAKERGLRVVWTLHDYKLLCPRYDCLRDGKPCELCLGGDKRFVLRHACLKGSRLASAVAFLEARKWNRVKLSTWTDAFLCPSHFMKAKMAAGGFPPDKLHVLHHFIDENKLAGTRLPALDYYCYAGRLSAEKGIRTLLQVAGTLPYPLKVLGTGPLEPELRRQHAGAAQIEFLGHRPWEDVRTILGQARFSVVPSECYEVLPLAAMESLCLGVPVLGARIGGIPELIRDAAAGATFAPGNARELAGQIQAMWTRGRPMLPVEEYAARFSASHYLKTLLPLYEGRR